MTRSTLIDLNPGEYSSQGLRDYPVMVYLDRCN